MEEKSPKDFLTVYHTFFKHVENAEVVFVKRVKAIIHVCTKSRRIVDAKDTLKESRVTMEKPTEAANSAGYCADCGTLYVQLDGIKDENWPPKNRR